MLQTCFIACQSILFKKFSRLVSVYTKIRLAMSDHNVTTQVKLIICDSVFITLHISILYDMRGHESLHPYISDSHSASQKWNLPLHHRLQNLPHTIITQTFSLRGSNLLESQRWYSSRRPSGYSWDCDKRRATFTGRTLVFMASLGWNQQFCCSNWFGF